MNARLWIYASATVLSFASTFLMAFVPGEGPPEARAILVLGFAVLTGLMGYLAKSAMPRREPPR